MAAAASNVRCLRGERSGRLDDEETLRSASVSHEQRSERKARRVHPRLSRQLNAADLEWQLEDRAFKHLMPREYRAVARLVRRKRAERVQYASRAVALLKQALKDAGVDGTVYGRTKHLYSIYRKLNRYHACGRKFDEIYDLTALRVLVGSVADCYSALGVVHELWRPLPGEFDDYIGNPKENLYQSLHSSVIGPEGFPLEVQIRTREMHRIAERGAASHSAYKQMETLRWETRLDQNGELPRVGH